MSTKAPNAGREHGDRTSQATRRALGDRDPCGLRRATEYRPGADNGRVARIIMATTVLSFATFSGFAALMRQ